MQSTSVRLESTFTYSVRPIAYPLMVLLDAGPSRGESRAGGIKALLSLTCMLMNQGQSQIAILVLRHAAILAVPHASSRAQYICNSRPEATAVSKSNVQTQGHSNI